MQEAWARGDFTAGFDVEMAVKNAAATGRCEAMQDILDMTIEDLMELGNE